jgi:hypothetical protein
MARTVRGRMMIFTMALLLGVSVCLRVSSTIRAVDFLQIFGCGMLFGVGLMGLITTLRERRGSTA